MTTTPAPRPITEVAAGLGIDRRFLIPHGDEIAKVRLDAREASGRPPGRLVLVSALTPTKSGEGKTTTSIGLAQGLSRIGEDVALALREPSLGPTFGVKGGATGGGEAVLTPAAEINLHFTGDFHAITSAHNLLAAMLDAHLQHGNELDIDVRRVLWPRVMDMNDRALRNIVVGLGGPVQGVPRESGFDITAASEIMATLCLAEDPDDLRTRLGRLLVALTRSGEPVTAADLQAVGAMVVLLKDALTPNLVQTIDGVPAFVHGGPFANIAHGCNSVVATKMAQAHADWTITEAGFGADLGAEKFLDIKCVSAGLEPSLVVLVATIRALKSHGGVAPKDLESPDPDAVGRGLANLAKHVENIQAYGLPPLVVLNRFGTDSDDEIAVVRRFAESHEVPFAVSDHFARGGEGAEDFARMVVESTPAEPPGFTPMYEPADSIPTKIEKVASTVYGARSVVFSKQASKDLALVERLGHGDLPVCIAKTPASLSDDPRLLGRPENFDVTVESMVLATGAGFVVPLLGSILRMPGLPKAPQAQKMDYVDGEVVGLLGA